MADALIDKFDNIHPVLERTNGVICGDYLDGTVIKSFWGLLSDKNKKRFNPKLIQGFRHDFVFEVNRFMRDWNDKNRLNDPVEDP